jgi:hypothetical protein
MERKLAAKRQDLEEKKRAVSATWAREGRLQREREEGGRAAGRKWAAREERKVAKEQAKLERREHERKAVEQAKHERLVEEQAEWDATSDWKTAEAGANQEQEAAAKKERLKHERARSSKDVWEQVNV